MMVRVASAVLILCAGLAPVSGVESGRIWYHRDWQTEDGLPSGNVTGIVQTRDNYLWLATQSGLARFDGIQFEEMPIPAKGAHLLTRLLLCDHAEDLWLAQDRGVVVRIGADASRIFTAADGLPDSLPLQMIESPAHEIWITYANRFVVRITINDQVQRVTAAEGLPEDGVCSLTVDGQGVLWFAKGAQYGFFRDGRFQKAGALSERNPLIFASREGFLWYCTSSQLLKLQTNATPVAVAEFDGGATRVKPSVLFEDSTGRLWIGTAADGLFLFDSTNLIKIDTSQNNIRALTEDREGDIWAGTEGGGLNRLGQKQVELYGPDDGLPFETVRSMAEDSAGDLWVVTQDGALMKLPKDDWPNGRKAEGWTGGQAHCIVADKHGVVWIGTYQHGLFRWQSGQFKTFTAQEGLAGLNVRSLLLDSRDGLWIGLESGHLVQRLDENRFQSFALPPDCGAVRTMAEDASGQIWMGTLDGRLFRVDGDKLLAVAQPSSVSSRPIRCMTALPDGTVWIGYAGAGVCQLRGGKLLRLGRENGLFDGNICALVPDEAGRMWFASDRGIFYVSLAEMNQFIEGRAPGVESIFFGRDSGLPSLQAYYGYWPGATVNNSGEILFPTHSGIAVVHPSRIHPNLQPPNVMIQSVLVDGRQIALDNRGHAASLPPGHRRIEIKFTAPSFVAPEQVRFRYRLEGWSDDWNETVRPRTAIFSRLPAGDYKFHVTAGNSGGVWNNSGASFDFIVAPFFWQAWPFRGIVALIFTAAVVALVRHFSFRNVRLKLRRAEQEAALQKERARIAQDMHDELGARFTQISLLGELSRNALAEPDKARDLLGQISGVAQVGVKSLDEIVWAVNPRNDTLPDLLDYTGQYARDFLAAANLRCRLDFPDDLPSREIPGDVRHAIFSVLKEALNNVAKHAQAVNVKIIFCLVDSQMQWTIEDDGKGFEQAPDNALADGLRNIAQRAAALGGKVDIRSHPGSGTRITLTIPLRH
jgi:signal transduction histidine kinase/ligand-binding sensor domain-containing protein